MPRFPGYGVPFQYYRPYNYRPYTPAPKTELPPKEIAPLPPPQPPPSSNRNQSPKDPVWFELFGIKLYFDDVLILSLLFFLYKVS